MTDDRLTRQQRRRLKRLAGELDAELAADRRYFQRFPTRRHRLRRAFPAEIAAGTIARGGLASPPPGQARFVVVRQIAEGVRGRLAVVGPADVDGDDVDEGTAQSIWERAAARHPELAGLERAVSAAAAA